MTKKNLILDIIGEKIKEYGFTYGLDKGYRGVGIWGFRRDVDSITQIIIIHKHRFTKALFLEFSTTAWGKGLVRANEIIPEGKYSNYYGQWDYENDDDFKNILLEFTEIIEKYGIDKLNEMSVEDKVIPTIEMTSKLIASPKTLSEQFIKQSHLYVENTSKENILKWFDLIQQKLNEIRDEPYENVQGALTEMAAFVGEQLRKELGGEWMQWKVDPRSVMITGLNSYLMTNYLPLDNIIEGWKNQNIKNLRQQYLYIMDGKLPMTTEQMIEYANSQDKYFT